jgi:hypothetical protein
MKWRHGRYRTTEPTEGLAVNKIKDPYKISKAIWNIDIARTPTVVRGIGDSFGIHNMVRRANCNRYWVEKSKRHFEKGRW